MKVLLRSPYSKGLFEFSGPWQAKSSSELNQVSR